MKILLQIKSQCQDVTLKMEGYRFSQPTFWRNAYAGETSCSAPLPYIRSTARSILLIFHTRQLLIAGVSLNGPIELTMNIMIRDCSFQLIYAYLDCLRRRSLPRHDIAIDQYTNKTSQAERLAPRSFSMYTIGCSRQHRAKPQRQFVIGSHNFSNCPSTFGFDFFLGVGSVDC